MKNTNSPDKLSDSNTVKILHTGNLKSSTTNGSLTEYLRNKTVDFQRLLTLAAGAKKAKWALVSYKSPQAAQETFVVLQDQQIGPQGSSIIVSFKKRRGRIQVSNTHHDTGEEVEQRNAEGFAAKDTASSSTDARNRFAKESKTANIVTAKINNKNAGTQVPKASNTRGALIGDSFIQSPRKKEIRGSSSVQKTKSEQSSAKPKLNTTDKMYKGGDQAEPYDGFSTMKKFAQEKLQDREKRVDVVSPSKVGGPYRFLRATGKNGAKLDQQRIKQFIKRTFSLLIVRYECTDFEAFFEFENNRHAECALNVLHGKQLTCSGAPVEVKYVLSMVHVSDDESDIQSQISDVPTSVSGEDCNKTVLKGILLVTVENVYIKTWNFRKTLKSHHIAYAQLKGHHDKEKMVGTLARIEFASMKEAVEAESKLKECKMGTPPSSVITEVMSHERTRKNRRGNRRQRKGRYDVDEVGNDDVCGISGDQANALVANGESVSDNSEYKLNTSGTVENEDAEGDLEDDEWQGGADEDEIKVPDVAPENSKRKRKLNDGEKLVDLVSPLKVEEPDRFLRATGKNGAKLDQQRIEQFIKRTFSLLIVRYECTDFEAFFEFENNRHAECAFNVLHGKQLTCSGAPVEVKYVSSMMHVSDDESDIQSQISDVPTTVSGEDCNKTVLKGILLVTVEHVYIKTWNFRKTLKSHHIAYEQLQVHHNKEQIVGTVARIEFASVKEALEAESKLKESKMGTPPTPISTQVMSHERTRKNRRRNRRQGKGRHAVEVDGNDDVCGISGDQANALVANDVTVGDKSEDNTTTAGNVEHDDAEGDLEDEGSQGGADEDEIEEPEVAHENSKRTCTSVLVRNIPKHITEKDVHTFLTAFDVDVQGMQFRRTFAIVQFQYPEEATEAWNILKRQSRGILGDNLQVKFIRTATGKGGNIETPRCPNDRKASIAKSNTGQKQAKPDTNNEDKKCDTKGRDLPGPNDVVIDNLPRSVKESDIVEALRKSPEKIRSGFIDAKLSGNRAVLNFGSQESAFEAVAELRFIRVRGHELNAKLAVHNPDFDRLMFRKQQEALITQIRQTERNISLEIEDNMNHLAIQICNLENDLLNCESDQEYDRLVITKDVLQNKLDENQGYYEEFRQTALKMVSDLDNIVPDNLEEQGQQSALRQIDDDRRQLDREGRRLRNPLPIYGRRSEILDTVTNPSTKACVIQAETGSGKSTQVPQYLIEYMLHQSCSSKSDKVVCTQPRRVAAMTLAQRIAEEYDCEVGHEIGFIVGNNRKVGNKTLATLMTDRTLLNLCLTDSKYLENYSYVIIDEAHERSVDTDILLAMLKEEQKRKEFTIIIMSATIDVDLFSRYFDGCPVIDIAGRTFPVDIEWCPNSDGQTMGNDDYVSRAVDKSYDIHMNEDDGDILVFLTSQAEIDHACRNLKRKLGLGRTEQGDDNIQIFPLHGKLQPHDQFKVFRRPRDGQRRVVFATNVAETSVTIPGVKYVIDTGMVKELQYDTTKNMSMLKVTSITKASANQRKGRAGRTGPGICYRLYAHEEFHEMDQSMKPEILRVHLGMAIMQLLQMGVREIETFDFVESPEPGAIEQAMKTLVLLGAVKDADKTLTDLGNRMAKLPVEPRLAKLILEGAKRDVVDEAIAMAALISAPGNVFYQGGSDAERQEADQLKLRFCIEEGDVLTLLGIFREWQRIRGEKEKNRWCKENSLNAKTLRLVQENVEELDVTIKRSKVIEELGAKEPTIDKREHMPNVPREDEAHCQQQNTNEVLRKILMSAFFENLSVFNGHKRAGYTVTSQLKTAVFHPSSALSALNLSPQWVIYGELRRTSNDFLCVVTPVDISWIHEVAPEQFNQLIDLEKLKSCVMTEVKIEAVGTAIMKILSKNRYEYIRNLEDEITRQTRVPCIIEANFDHGNLTVFIASHSSTLAEEVVKASLQKIKAKSQREQIEVSVGTYGSVRQVVKSGGETGFVLMTEDVYVTVEWSGIAEDMPEDVLCQWLEEIYINEDEIVDVMKYPKHFTAAKQGKWGKTTFISARKAEEAVESGPDIDPSGQVIVEPVVPKRRTRGVAANIHYSVTFNTRLTVSWFRRRSKGHAFVNCHSPQDAWEVKDQLDLNLGYDHASVRIGNKKKNTVFVGNLDKDITTEELRKDVNNSTDVDVINVFIPREKNEDGISDASHKRNLRDIFSDVCDKVEVHIPEDRGRRGIMKRAYITLEQNLGEEEHDTLTEIADEGCRAGNGELYRVKKVVTCDLYCSQRVFRSVEDALRREGDLSECKVDFADTKRTPPDKRIHISGEEFLDVEEFVKKMQAILSPDEVQARSLVSEDVTHVWMDKVLNKLMKQHFNNILRRHKAHGEIHVRRQEVKLYGEEGDREALKEDLKKFFSIALKTMFREVDIGSRSGGQRGQAMRSLIRRYGPHLKNLKIATGVDNITVDLKRGLLFIDGAEDAYDALVGEIDEVLKDLVESARENEVITDECGVCFCTPQDADSKPYRLAACGHFFCLACLKDHVKESGTSKKFPINCPECDDLIMLCDIKTVYPDEKERQELYTAGLDAYVTKNADRDLMFCPGPDCCMIFEKEADGDKVKCEECGYRYCSGCGEKPHPQGMNCKEFKISQEQTNDVAKWMKESGADAKKCPVCPNTVIERNKGCKHMTCRMCKKHICWRCLKFFNTAQECYAHLGAECGGIFDNEEPVQPRLFQPPPQQPHQQIANDHDMVRFGDGDDFDRIRIRDREILDFQRREIEAQRQRREAVARERQRQRLVEARRQREAELEVERRRREEEAVRERQREARRRYEAEQARERRRREDEAWALMERQRRETAARAIRERQQRDVEAREAERQRQWQALYREQRQQEGEVRAERRRREKREKKNCTIL